MIIFIVLLVTVFIGVKLLEVLGFNVPWYEKLSLSFLLSSALQTLGYFTILKLGVMATNLTYLAFLCVLLLLVLAIPKFLPKLPMSPVMLASSSSSYLAKNGTKLLWLGIFVLFAITAIYTTYLPVYTTDSLILYDFRSKVIAETGTLNSIRIVPDWAAYPMFTSTIHLFVRLLGYTNPNLFYPLMYLAFAGVFYGAVRVRLSQFKASLMTFLMYSTPLTLWQSKLDGMTNLPYAIFYCIAVIYLGKYWKNSKPIWQYVIISALFLGFASWTRHTEPFWAIPIFLIVLSSFFKRNLLLPGIYIAMFWFIRQIWPSYTHGNYISVVGATQSIVNNSNSLFTGTSYDLFDTFKIAVKFVLNSFNEGLSPLIYLYLSTITIELFWNSLKSQVFYIIVVLGNIFILFLSVVFAINTFSYWSGLSNSFTRMLSYLAPLLWLYISNSRIWYRIEEWGK